MHLVGSSRLDAFSTRHADARSALAAWTRTVRAARWGNFTEVRSTYNSADPVSPFTVFNVRGNRYRVITEIDYERQTVYIREVLTHAAYDQGAWKRGGA